MGPTTLLLRTAVVPAVTKTSWVQNWVIQQDAVCACKLLSKLIDILYTCSSDVSLSMQQEKGSDCTEAKAEGASQSAEASAVC